MPTKEENATTGGYRNPIGERDKASTSGRKMHPAVGANGRNGCGSILLDQIRTQKKFWKSFQKVVKFSKLSTSGRKMTFAVGANGRNGCGSVPIDQIRTQKKFWKSFRKVVKFSKS